jgi:hypothetical protein
MRTADDKDFNPFDLGLKIQSNFSTELQISRSGDKYRHHALVAELVDALVSNTNEVTLVPVRLRPKVQQTPSEAILEGFLWFLAILNIFRHFDLRSAISFTLHRLFAICNGEPQIRSIFNPFDLQGD